MSDERRATPIVSLIVARAANGVIGDQGRLPWHIPSELKHFKAVTMGHPVIMGRKTWESIGRPLPGRRSIVITRQKAYTAAGALVVGSLDEAIAACTGEDEIFVIGGEQIYRAALPIAQRMYITVIERDFAGDTFFPAYDHHEWYESNRLLIADDPSGLPLAYVTLERAQKAAWVT
jgi:dihydrofolate reductase